MNIETNYSLRDRVMILAIQRPGRVEAISLDNLGLSYRVSYWDNCKKDFAWLTDEDIAMFDGKFK